MQPPASQSSPSSFVVVVVLVLDFLWWGGRQQKQRRGLRSHLFSLSDALSTSNGKSSRTRTRTTTRTIGYYSASILLPPPAHKRGSDQSSCYLPKIRDAKRVFPSPPPSLSCSCSIPGNYATPQTRPSWPSSTSVSPERRAFDQQRQKTRERGRERRRGRLEGTTPLYPPTRSLRSFTFLLSKSK